MTTAKIMRTVFCDVREGSLISQSTPYSNLDWQEVSDTRIKVGSYYQAVFQTKIPEKELFWVLKNDNGWVKGQGFIATKDFYKLFCSSFRLHRRLGELSQFDKYSYPILGDEYRWEWAKYLSAHCFGYDLTN